MPRKRKPAAAEVSGGKHKQIAFGLVNVPVRVKPVAKPASHTSLGRNKICEKHQVKLKQQMRCPVGNDSPDVVMAFPLGKKEADGFVVVPDDQLEALVDEATTELTLSCSFAESEVSPIYYKKAYTVRPGDGAADATTLHLFTEVIRELGVAIQGAITMGSKSELVVLRWDNDLGCLFAHTCLYDEQINWADIQAIAEADQALPDSPAPARELAVQILQTLAGSFEPDAVTDTYTPAVRDLVATYAAGKKPPAVKAPAAPTVAADDLMANLQRSLTAAKAKAAPAANGKKPAAKAKVKA